MCFPNGPAFPSGIAKRARPRREPSDAIGNLVGRCRPINLAVFFLEQRSHGGLAMILWLWCERPFLQSSKGFNEQGAAHLRQFRG